MIGQVHVIRGNNTIYHTKGCKKKDHEKKNHSFTAAEGKSNCHVFVLDLSILDPFIET